jgi:hypothetical protein
MGLAPSGNRENLGKSVVAKVPVPIFSQPRNGRHKRTSRFTSQGRGIRRAIRQSPPECNSCSPYWRQGQEDALQPLLHAPCDTSLRLSPTSGADLRVEAPDGILAAWWQGAEGRTVLPVQFAQSPIGTRFGPPRRPIDPGSLRD